MNNSDKIRLEIERLKEENRNIRCQHNEKYCTGYDDAFNDLLAFIDSLPDEIPPYCTGFKGDPDPPGISYLEEAAEEYAIPFNDTTYGCEYSYKGFIAGAKWNRQQMLKGAKDGYVSAIIIHNDGDEEHYAVTYPNGERPHSITDKVKIIFL